MDAVGFAVLLSLLYGFPELPISLTIQLVGSDKDSPFRVFRIEDYHISGNALVGLNLYDVTDLDVHRQHLLPASISDGCVLSGIRLLVTLLSVDIVVGLFHHGKSQNQQQRSDVCEQEAHLEHIHQLAEGDQQEEQVEEVPELVVEHQREERLHCVLAVIYDIGLLHRLRVDLPVEKHQALLRERTWIGKQRFWKGYWLEHCHGISRGGGLARSRWFGLFKLHYMMLKATASLPQSQVQLHFALLELGSSCLGLGCHLLSEVE